MKKEIIKTEDYLLVVDDTDIKDVRLYKGMWHLEKRNILNKFPDYLTDLSECKLVIAHLPLNDSPILDGVPVLPSLEDDVEMMAKDKWKKIGNTGEVTWGFKDGYKCGYNKAKETYKFTEEDMRQAFRSGFIYSNLHEVNENSYIQSLSQPKTPTHFEFEMEGISKIVGNTWQDYKSIKTITNAQGQIVVCGKYIY